MHVSYSGVQEDVPPLVGVFSSDLHTDVVGEPYRVERLTGTGHAAHWRNHVPRIAGRPVFSAASG